MDRWTNKIAVVTGASSGIGAAIALDLALAGMKVIGLARRQERVDELNVNIPAECSGSIHSFKCDVSIESEILAAFAWITKEFGGIDVLVNNAGIARQGRLVTIQTDLLREVIDTNLMAAVYCVREAFASMQNRGADGHIILINSVLGHKVPFSPTLSKLNAYAPTKYALTAMTEVLRQELLAEQTKIKVTSISPGYVRTEIVSEQTLRTMPLLEAKDISDAVLYVLGTPPRVQIHELTIKPVGEIY